MCKSIIFKQEDEESELAFVGKLKELAGNVLSVLDTQSSSGFFSSVLNTKDKNRQSMKEFVELMLSTLDNSHNLSVACGITLKNHFVSVKVNNLENKST